MQVIWLNKALRNLEDAAEYVARDNPVAAQALVQRIHDATALLGGNPSIGRPGRIPDTRELVVAGTNYIVPYRVRAQLNRVEILRVFHASRRLPERW